MKKWKSLALEKIPQSGWKILPPSHFQNIPAEEITYTGKIPPYGAKNSHFENHYMEKFFRILVGLYGKIF